MTEATEQPKTVYVYPPAPAPAPAKAGWLDKIITIAILIFAALIGYRLLVDVPTASAPTRIEITATARPRTALPTAPLAPAGIVVVVQSPAPTPTPAWVAGGGGPQILDQAKDHIIIITPTATWAFWSDADIAAWTATAQAFYDDPPAAPEPFKSAVEEQCAKATPAATPTLVDLWCAGIDGE